MKKNEINIPNGLKTGLKVAAFPIIGFFKLFIIPFLIPFLLAKKIFNKVRYARGLPGHEVNSFDVWYEIKNLNEAKLNYMYKRCASMAWMSLLFFILFMSITIFMACNGTKLLFVSSSLSLTILVFTQYFHFVVFAYCFKIRSFDYKLYTFKSLEDILPNPFNDIAMAKKDGKEIPVQFYPKGRNILKK
ncbi:hypothetical protein AHT95_24655 [Salmonella enterica subsp. enterica]|nr:hypothetical protein [Salmonella enterica subsp. enterica serovar Coleypark]